MKEKKQPLRMCACCRLKLEKKALFRVVKDQNGIVSFDLESRKSGKGAYVCRNVKCIELAKKNKCLDRALNVHVEAGIYEILITKAGE